MINPSAEPWLNWLAPIAGIYILTISPLPWGVGYFWPKLRNREGGLEKRKGKGGKRRKKEKSDKTHVKIPL